MQIANAEKVLKMVGAGLFVGASLLAPSLPRAYKKLFKEEEQDIYKRFNIYYLKRYLKRLEKQKMVRWLRQMMVQK